MRPRCLGLSFLTLLALGATAVAAEFRGVITRVDPEKKEVVLEGRGKGARGTSMTFHVDKDTQIVVGQEAGALADLATGKRVRVTYEVKGGKDVATQVHSLFGKPAVAVVRVPDDPNAGTLQSIALTDREIVVIRRDHAGTETETTHQVPESARIMRADKPIKLEDLKEGERVAVKAEKRGGKMVAESIQVVTGAAAEPSKITRLRGILQMIDQLLEMAEQKRPAKP